MKHIKLKSSKQIIKIMLKIIPGSFEHPSKNNRINDAEKQRKISHIIPESTIAWHFRPVARFFVATCFSNLCGGTPWTDFGLFCDPSGPMFLNFFCSKIKDSRAAIR